MSKLARAIILILLVILVAAIVAFGPGFMARLHEADRHYRETESSINATMYAR
jgi:hypothetical protein